MNLSVKKFIELKSCFMLISKNVGSISYLQKNFLQQLTKSVRLFSFDKIEMHPRVYPFSK